MQNRWTISGAERRQRSERRSGTSASHYQPDRTAEGGERNKDMGCLQLKRYQPADRPPLGVQHVETIEQILCKTRKFQ